MNRLMRMWAVEAATGLDRSSIYRRVSKGVFPKPVRLGNGANAVGWPESEVECWIQEQIAVRDNAATSIDA